MKEKLITNDGNFAAAYIAHKVSEVCAIYPITPSSTMGELADQWSSEGKTNIWGTIPLIAEMQSEGGAAGTVHGSLQTGALTSTFTASQGLLLMIPNMFKISGELTPAVFHVAARALASQALSIFGDHSDVMAARAAGFAQLCSSSVQEAHDLALIAHAATLEARIPFMHFFDGFRTSHEVSKITLIPDEVIRQMIRDEFVIAHRQRGLSPEHPVVRGTAQNPDVYFQAREACNPYYYAVPGIVQKYMDEFGKLTGRKYKLFEYFGAPDPERVLVIMGSGADTARETVEYLQAQGEKVGMIQVHLYRPFSIPHFRQALPESVKVISVLDRCKEPGATGEPLYLDVVAAMEEAAEKGTYSHMPRVFGGRYGLSSKDFTPGMVKAVFDEMKKEKPKRHYTVGINDDVMHSSLEVDPNFVIEHEGMVQAMFYGLGSDGTVGANKNTIKIIGEGTDNYAQGYFVYDSKKSGSRTVSHVRFGPENIRSTYLIQKANFIGCHQFSFLEQVDVLKNVAEGGILLLNSHYAPDELWDKLPRTVQETVVEKKLKLYVIDGYKVAREAGMGSRINTVMQTCFFAISGVLPPEEAINKIKEAIKKTYSKKGEEVVKKNFAAVDASVANMHQVEVPDKVSSLIEMKSAVPAHAPDFVRNVTAMMMVDRGDEIPVSALPADGTFPTATTQWEKRNISMFVPEWEEDLCIQCGNCSIVCPHGVIRTKMYDEALLAKAPDGFKSMRLRGRGFPGQKYTLEIFEEDCTGCGLCVEVCPAKSKEKANIKAINMTTKADDMTLVQERIKFFESIPIPDRGRVDFSTVRGVQYLEPLFEFSGACAGCGETPYVKLLTQLFGDRMVMANATGCSSIYGGNLPTTPYTVNDEGRGPAWSNSLFEDNAEFGFGFCLAHEKHQEYAVELLHKLADQIGQELVDDILTTEQKSDGEIHAQRERVKVLKAKLHKIHTDESRQLASVADHLLKRSIWIMGGDGWAYDIGFGGLDHVLANGRNINVLVLDTEVYSNTGGQASKSTPLGAVAKFAASGKATGKKDLAMMAMSYGNVYVAKVSMGAKPQQVIQALREAEAYDGPSLVIAYSHCIAHGINMTQGLHQQKLAEESGYWTLFRYNPDLAEAGKNPLTLDSNEPKRDLQDFAYNEIRYKILKHTHPHQADAFMEKAQRKVRERFKLYEDLAATPGSNDKLKPESE